MDSLDQSYKHPAHKSVKCPGESNGSMEGHKCGQLPTQDQSSNL